MGGLIEKYAFITELGYNESCTVLWPHAIRVGNYRMVQYTQVSSKGFNNEAELGSRARSLGYDPQHHSDSKLLIAKMEAGQEGPFVCHHGVCQEIINYFNPTEDL